jgi:hypothetical protein
MNKPLPNSYWVVADRLLAGEHPWGGDEPRTRERLERLREAGVDTFIDLTEVGEVADYHGLLPRGAQYTRHPIVDTSVPSEFGAMETLQANLAGALDSNRRVYVHCRAGIGRTGLVIGCYLSEQGLNGKASLRELNRLWRESERSKTWPKVPQTQQQADYITRWSSYRRPFEGRTMLDRLWRR